MTPTHINKSRTCSLIVFLFFSHVVWASAKTGPAHNKVVVCYISSWAVYRPEQGAYSLGFFDPNLCTHAVYAFAGLDDTQTGIKSLDPWQDLKENYGKGGYEHLTSFKVTHPHLKVHLGLGGWNAGSKNFSILAADATKRSAFIKQTVTFLRNYNFDGLEMHWEYPTARGGEPKDRANFVQLLKELSEEFSKHDLLLSSGIRSAKYIIDDAYDIKEISRYLNYLHIMCYDYHGSWDKKIGYNSPLVGPDGDIRNVQFTIDYLMKLGAPPEKIILGLPFYGRTFKTSFSGNIGDDSEEVGFQGPFVREDGFLGYNEICNTLNNKALGWTTHWDSRTSQMLARSGRDLLSGMVQVITFDTGRSIANKVRFALQKKLAGFMVWTVDTDDFLGECEPEKDIYADFKLPKSGGEVFAPLRPSKNYPLLRTVNEAVTIAQEEAEGSSGNDFVMIHIRTFSSGVVSATNAISDFNIIGEKNEETSYFKRKPAYN